MQTTARSTARRRLAAAGLVLLVPALGACGFGYQTDQVYQPGVGSDVRSDGVDVLAAVIVSGLEGSGTFVASLSNTDPEGSDQLTAVSGDGVEAAIAAPVDVPAGGLVNLADTGAVSVSGDDVKPGNFVTLELEFANGDAVSVDVPVVPKDGVYDDVKVAVPSATPSPSAG